MGGFASRKCKMLLHNMSNILGIELLICTNALNILQLKSSDRLMKIYNYIRTRI
jgi:histidine ammonia-lyase